MKRGRGRQSSSPADRAAQIENVVQAVMRESSGGRPDIDRLAQRYPELMPELGQQLQALLAIQNAAAQAPGRTPTSTGAGLVEVGGIDDLQFLQEELTDYEILDRVQYGGQGVVYKALQRATKRPVALKVLLDGPLATPRQRLRFAREVELSSRLQHPNIVTIYESGVVRGRNYCAMEFIEGLPIDEYVLLHAPPAREIVALFVTVCRAVNSAHQRGVIHRDLSPTNIMVDLDGRPHVLDFGLAKDAWAGSEDGLSISVAGQVVGTLPFLSPEQVEGRNDQVDVRSDVYALGVVLYQLLAGVLPYPDADDLRWLRDRILHAEPIPLRKAARQYRGEEPGALDGLTRDLEMILNRTLAKDKEGRYQSAAALADDLERYLAGDAVVARAQNRGYVLRKTMRRHRLAFGIAAAAVLVLGATTAIVTTLWIEASFQRDNAREAARVAHTLFDQVVTEVDSAIRPLAGGIEVRDRLLGTVATELPTLERLATSDAALVNILQDLHERQGDIDLAQGRKAEAEGHFRAMRDIARQRAETATDDASLRSAVARAYRKMAGVADDPEACFSQAVAIGTELLGAHPDQDAIRYALCETRLEYGNYLYSQAAHQRAVEQFEEGGFLIPPAAKIAEGDERWIAIAALSGDRGSQPLFALGRATQAIALLEESQRLRAKLAAAHPADVDCRNLLAGTTLRLADAYRQGGQADAARRLFEEAVATAKYLTFVDPSVAQWQHNLVAALDGFADALISAGELESAAAHCESLIEITTRLVQSSPSDVTWGYLLSSAHWRRGQVSLARDRPEAAIADFEEAVRIRENLCVREPDNLWRKCDLATAQDWQGKCYRKLGRTADALRSYEQAYQLRQGLLAAQPNVLERQLDVVLSQTKLATWHLDQKTAEHDVLATELLTHAEAAMLKLYAGGRLDSLDGRYGSWLPAIHRNQRLIETRARSRMETASDAAAAETPEASPAADNQAFFPFGS